jgi:hypothetical protein
MGYRRIELRLTGKDLFIFYHRDIGIGDNSIKPGGCTNKRILSKQTGIDYNTLMRVFTRQRRCYYETDGMIILKVSTGDIKKGSQSLGRRGKGGMDRFIERYTIKRSSDY